MHKIKILCVIDCQNDFIDGILGTKEAQNIIPNIVERIKEFDSPYIIYTKDTHDANYEESTEGKHIPAHCIRNSQGWELNKAIHDVLVSMPNLIYCVEKDSFGSELLARMVKQILLDQSALFWKDIDLEIELVGLCTNICVISNALMLASSFPKAIIKVNSSCCAGTTIENHNKALDIMKQCLVEIK